MLQYNENTNLERVVDGGEILNRDLSANEERELKLVVASNYLEENANTGFGTTIPVPRVFDHKRQSMPAHCVGYLEREWRHHCGGEAGDS